MRWNSALIVVMGFLFLTLVSAQQQNVYNDCEIYGNCIPEGDTFINQTINATQADNSTDFWDTDQGSLKNLNSSQFEEIDEKLTAKTSYWDLFYCVLTGCFMTGTIDMGGNNITSVDNISMTGNIISQNIKEGINVWALNSTDDEGVSIIVAITNTASFAALLSIGSLADPPTSQFTKSGDTVGDVHNDSGLYCSGGRCFVVNNGVQDIIFGHILNGDNNFTNASFSLILQGNGTLIMQGPIRLNSEAIFLDFLGDHFLRVNSEGDTFNGIAQNATWFGHVNPRPDGEITYLFTVENKTKLWLTAEKNNSVAGISNSLFVLPDYWGTENFTEGGIINMTKLSDYPTLCSTFGPEFFIGNDTCRSFADTREQGLPLLATGQLEVWLETFLHNGIISKGDAVFALDDHDFNIFNGSALIQDPVTFQEGFEEGEEVIILTESFTGGLGFFDNLQVDAGNWFSNLDARCNDGECANANGISGSGNIFMQTNVSTFNLNETHLTFVYSLQQIVGGNTFNVYANNNSGSGQVLLFSDSGTDLLVSQDIDLGSEFENSSILTLEFECDATNFNRECFVDTLRVNATAAATTIANVSSFNSVLNFGDGDLLGDGFPARGIFYIAENDTTFIRGEVEFQTVNEQTINVTESITLKEETITDWDNVSLFDDNVLLTDGSRELTADWDAGDPNIDANINATGGKNISRVDAAIRRVVTTSNILGIPITTTFCDGALGRFCLLEDLILIDIRGSKFGSIRISNPFLTASWMLFAENTTENFVIEQTIGSGEKIELRADTNITGTIFSGNWSNQQETSWIAPEHNHSGDPLGGEVIQHNTTDSGRSLNTIFVNTGERWEIHRVTIDAFADQVNDVALADAEVNGTAVAGAGWVGFQNFPGENLEIRGHFTFNVAPGESYSVNTTIVGAGAVTLIHWVEEDR